MKSIRRLTFLFIFLMLGQSLYSQANRPGEEASLKTDESSGKIKIRRRRRTLRRSRIQELERYHKKKKGTDIFGVGLLGFHAGVALGNVNGLTKAGAPSDNFAGLGAGILMDIQLAKGKTNSIGIKSSGGWLWRWGARAQFDFIRSNTQNATLRRETNELQASMIVKYYIPMEEISFTRNIAVLNRFHWFAGVGSMWSVGISDVIEHKQLRTFSNGPNQSDMFFYSAVGFNARVTTTSWFTFDFGFGLNLTSEIDDNLTGRVINGTGSGGHLFKMHTGFAYAF